MDRNQTSMLTFIDSPVVTKADLMAAGDQVGCLDLMSAAIPATWGQDIEVPDKNMNPLLFLLPLGGNAAKMSTPGAAMSGYLHQSFPVECRLWWHHKLKTM